MARRDSSPDFIEALARGLDVLRAFQPGQPVMSLAAVAAAASLPRPTARRILVTLEKLGYVRTAEHGGYELTPRVLELGTNYMLSRSLWEVARPHMERLVARTHESSSIAQLDGSDIVYVAGSPCRRSWRWRSRSAPGSRPCRPRWARCCWRRCRPRRPSGCWPSRAGQGSPRDGSRTRPSARPSCGGSGPAVGRSPTEQLALGIRSVAAPLRDGDGRVLASLNVTMHAAETPVEVLTGDYLPLLLQAAGAISADWAATSRRRRSRSS